ncbi:hypothetical protein M153_1698300069, partial [Pseudoloma neurophilia]
MKICLKELQFKQYSLIELCILPQINLFNILSDITVKKNDESIKNVNESIKNVNECIKNVNESIKNDESIKNVMFLDTRGCLSAVRQYNIQNSVDQSQITLKLYDKSVIFRIYDIKDFLKICSDIKKHTNSDIILFIDTLTCLIDSLSDKSVISLIYNEIWSLIYFNKATIFITNHYKRHDTFYVPRLGLNQIINVDYRVLVVKNNKKHHKYE